MKTPSFLEEPRDEVTYILQRAGEAGHVQGLDDPGMETCSSDRREIPAPSRLSTQGCALWPACQGRRDPLSPWISEAALLSWSSAPWLSILLGVCLYVLYPVVQHRTSLLLPSPLCTVRDVTRCLPKPGKGPGSAGLGDIAWGRPGCPSAAPVSRSNVRGAAVWVWLAKQLSFCPKSPLLCSSKVLLWNGMHGRGEITACV